MATGAEGDRFTCLPDQHHRNRCVQDALGWYMTDKHCERLCVERDVAKNNLVMAQAMMRAMNDEFETATSGNSVTLQLAVTYKSKRVFKWNVHISRSTTSRTVYFKRGDMHWFISLAVSAPAWSFISRFFSGDGRNVDDVFTPDDHIDFVKMMTAAASLVPDVLMEEQRPYVTIRLYDTSEFLRKSDESSDTTLKLRMSIWLTLARGYSYYESRGFFPFGGVRDEWVSRRVAELRQTTVASARVPYDRSDPPEWARDNWTLRDLARGVLNETVKCTEGIRDGVEKYFGTHLQRTAVKFKFMQQLTPDMWHHYSGRRSLGPITRFAVSLN